MTAETERYYLHFRHLRDAYRAELDLGPNVTAAERAAARAQAGRRAYAEWLRERRQLRRDAETREDAPKSTTVYEGYDHEQLYRMAKDNNVPAQVGDVSESWSKLANAMARFSDRLREQVTRTDAVWQGRSAEIARDYAADMSVWSEQTGRDAQLVSQQASQQSHLAAWTSRTMPEPVAAGENADMRQWLDDPAAMPELAEGTLARQQQRREAKAEAVRVMQEYDRGLEDAVSRQPRFTPPPRLDLAGGTASELPTTTATAGLGAAGGGGAPPGTVGAPSVSAELPRAAGGDVSGRTSPAMPFHSGGAGPAVARGGAGVPGTAGGGNAAAAAQAAMRAWRDREDERRKRGRAGEEDDEFWLGGLPAAAPSVIGEPLGSAQENTERH